MKQDVVGINEQILDKLILDIYDYADRINRTLNSIEDVVAGSSSYFNDDVANSFRYKFEQLKLNFPMVNHNILSYANDLVKVKRNFSDTTSDMIYTIKKKTNEISMDDIELL